MTTSPLVGRVKDMKRLKKALLSAPSAVLVGGEAGIGKTRLVREFTAQAGVRVLGGGCVELAAEGLPFAPFTAALRGLVREIGVEGVHELVPGSSGLARLLPEFGEPEETTVESQARLFELVLTLLERLAPAVLVIEDVHWADRSSRDLLDFLVRNLSGQILVLITYRSDALHRSHPLRPLLAELARVDRVERLDLRRLTLAETRRLLASKTEIDGVLAEQVFRRSEGNPLFAEELADAGGAELPESLRDLLLAGVRKLPEETQEILRVAAAGGQRLDHRLLSAVVGLDDTSLNRGLRPAVAATVLSVDGDGYSFRHALISEAIHDDLLPGELTRLHTRYAETLEEQPELVPPGSAAAELAYHWYAAHDLPRALDSAWRAAGEATRSAAHAEALRLLERVLELWDQVPPKLSYLDVLIKAVSAAQLTGEYDKGIKYAKAALKETSDPEVESWLLGHRGRMLLHQNRAEGMEDLRESVRRIPVHPPSKARSSALAALSKYLFKLPGARSEAKAAAEEAVELAREVDDPTAEASARITLTVLSREPDDVRIAELDRIEPIMKRSSDYDDVLRLKLAGSHILEGAGRHEDAIRVARMGAAEAEEYGLARIAGTILAINMAEPMVSLGRWDEALEVIEKAVERHPLRRHLASLRGLAGEIHTARGDFPMAQYCLDAAWSPVARGTTRKAEELFPVIRLDASLRLAQGRPEQVLKVTEPVLEDAGLVDESRYTWPVLVLAARACPDAAALAPFAARAVQLKVSGPVHQANKLTFDAEAARLRGTVPDWDAAIAAWTSLSQPYQQALCQHRAATCAAAAGDRDKASTYLHSARVHAEHLAARPLLTEINDLAGRLGRSTPAHGLTARELEVLRELAEGRANREIAASLFISAKTVSVHVSNILAKLGASSRGEAAAAARKLGIPG